MKNSSPYRAVFFRQSLAAALLCGSGVLVLNAPLHAQTTYTFTNGGTPSNTGSFQNPASWSGGVVPTSTATGSDTATFDGTGGGNVAGAPLVLTDTVTDGGGAGTQGISLVLTAGQAGGLTLNDTGSVRLASVGTSTATATPAVTIAAGAGPLSISSVVIGGLTTATFSSFTNNSASTFSMAALQPGGGNARTLIFFGSGNYTVTGPIIAASSALNITKGTGANTDPGTLTLLGNNTYTGVTTINSGPIVISTATGLGAAGTATNTGTGAAPAFSNTGDTVITSGSGSALNTGQLQVVGGATGLTIAETFVVGGRSAVSGGGTDLFLNVSGANTFSGTVNFSSGGTDYGIRADAGSLTLASAIAPFGGSKIFDITGNGGVILNGVISNPQGSGTTTVNRTVGFTGTLTLSGNNLYTGNTNINGGTLLVNNMVGGTTGASATGTGPVAIAATATLAGGSGAGNGGVAQTLGGARLATYTPGLLGTIAGAVTVASGGTIAPGSNAVGTLTVASLTLNSTAATPATGLIYEFNSTANDLISVTGALNIAGATTLTLLQEGTATAFQTNGLYNLLGYGAGSTITLANLAVANAVNGVTYTFLNDTVDGLVQLRITGGTSVPEPSTWAVALLGLGVVGLTFRRRLTASAPGQA